MAKIHLTQRQQSQKVVCFAKVGTLSVVNYNAVPDFVSFVHEFYVKLPRKSRENDCSLQHLEAVLQDTMLLCLIPPHLFSLPMPTYMYITLHT